MVTLFETQGESGYGGYLYLQSDVSPISLSTPINVETNQGFSTACNSAFYFMSNTTFKYFAIFDSQPTFTKPGDVPVNLKQSGNYWYAYGELATYRNQSPLRDGVLTVFDNNTDYVDFITAPVQFGGGAGSGYIGNSLLSNKKMVGYNVPTSSATDTKTESVNVFDSNYVANKPKAGNGHARIKYLATYKEYTFEELIKTADLTHYKETYVGQYVIDDNWSTLSQWLDTDWNLSSQNGYGTYQLVKDNDEYILGTNSQSSMSLYALPLKNKIKVKALIFDGKFNTLTSASGSQMHLRMGCTNNGVHSIVGALTVSQGDGFDYKVTDTNYHTFIKQFNSIETNYLEFYNGQYKDYFKNIKVIVEE